MAPGWACSSGWSPGSSVPIHGPRWLPAWWPVFARADHLCSAVHCNGSRHKGISARPCNGCRSLRRTAAIRKMPGTICWRVWRPEARTRGKCGHESRADTGNWARCRTGGVDDRGGGVGPIARGLVVATTDHRRRDVHRNCPTLQPTVRAAVHHCASQLAQVTMTTATAGPTDDR